MSKDPLKPTLDKDDVDGWEEYHDLWGGDRRVPSGGGVILALAACLIIYVLTSLVIVIF